MRFVISTLILFLCVPGIAQQQQEKTTPLLEATTSILEQINCITDSGMAADGQKIVSVRVDLTLKVQYKNTGTMPIIIHRNSGTVGGEKIAFTVEDAQRKAYVYDTINNIMSVAVDDNGNVITPSKDKSLSPSKEFVVINPDDFYASKSQTRLLFDLPENYKKYDNRTGYLQLALWTSDGVWSQVNEEDEVRTRWQPFGYLWTKGLRSQPMLVQFPSVTTLGKCKPN